jgi:hypothetical protein
MNNLTENNLLILQPFLCNLDKKYTIKEGRVYNEKNEFAILLSPGYGAGWSTWDANLFCPLAVMMLLSERKYYQHEYE